MSGRPDPMPNKSLASYMDRSVDETIEEPPPTTPEDNASQRAYETYQPRPRHMRGHSSDSLGGGSSRSLNSGSKGKFRHGGSPATLPGVTTVIPRSGRSGVAVKEALAFTESGLGSLSEDGAGVVTPPDTHKPKTSAVARSASHDTVVTAATESFEDYMSRKRARLQDLEGGDVPEGEGEVDPYAHLRNQPRKPRPETDSTLSPASMDCAFEVVATPVYDDDNSGGNKKKKNPLKDWRVLLFLAVALSAIVGLTVALLMKDNGGGGGDEKALSSPGGGGSNSSGGSEDDNSFPVFVDPSGGSPEEPDDSLEYDGGGGGDATEDNGSGAVTPTIEPTPEPTLAPTTLEPTTLRPTRAPVTWPTTNDPTSAPTPRPTPRPTLRPTDKPTPRPTLRPTDKPTNSPTRRPTSKPTLPPTEARSDIQEDGLKFEVDPFSMLIVSEEDIDESVLLGITVTHLALPIQQVVPNFGGMNFNIDMSSGPVAVRRLRSLQSTAYVAFFSGHIILKDTSSTPSPLMVRSVIKNSFAHSSLQRFLDAMDDAKMDVAAIVVKDASGSIWGSKDEENILGPNQGTLKTTLSNRFSRPGVMFDISAKDFPVTINSIDVHIESTESNIPVEFWTKSGSYEGYERDSDAWTPRNGGAPYIIPTGFGVGKLTPIPKVLFESFTVPAGQTVGVYITLQEGKGMLLGQASSLTSEPEDSYVKISPAVSVGFRFGQTNNDRAWGGAIRYEIPL